MLERYEESMIDLETLLKIDPSNTAAKKELQAVMKLKEEEVPTNIMWQCVRRMLS
jgi:RIO-like serine/threonine protein kinase